MERRPLWIQGEEWLAAWVLGLGEYEWKGLKGQGGGSGRKGSIITKITFSCDEIKELRVTGVR